VVGRIDDRLTGHGCASVHRQTPFNESLPMRKFFGVLLLLLFALRTCAAEAQPKIDDFYQSIESNIREQYEEFLKSSESERQRKKKAGEPPLTADQSKEGMSAGRFIIYNRTILTVLCAEQTARTAQSANFDEVEKCFIDKRDQMNKYLKLEEYAGTLGAEKFTRCQIKTRNFTDEIRFPPYGFLRDPTGYGPKLYHFDELNECILSGL
jgi:hypothetical protein